ncbi:MAG: hypothetical protein GXX94_06450 [Chloroflexi bacterium]|nr:hypothetical protein [Chloroflexota bacterium]
MHDRERLFIPYGRGPRNGGARVDLRMVAFFGTVLILLALAGWLYLRQASEVAALASEIRQLELEKEDRHRALVTLRGEVAMLGSLKRVLAEGTELGYALPDEDAGEGSFVVECTADCALPRPWVGDENAAMERAQAGSLLWGDVVERLGNVLRAAFPTW